jgi:hypothetical protein
LQWFGGLVAYAQNSVFLNVRVTGEVNLTTNIPPPYAQNVWKTVNGSPVLDVTAVNTDGFNVGGIVGYGNAVYLNNVAALKPIITATSNQTAVFIGGIAGFTDESTINGADSTVLINGNGPGYNTSAGGVGGYIVGTTVTNASADARITLQALSTEFGWSDSWQIDAGGLIGYAGGSATTASYITRSSATGTVDAYAPFPYAGGFIGYVYGYNNFSDPARNGTTITESYATGNVTSRVQDNGVIGNIPYAGGFAGYSSVGDSRIVDSYARGNATATTTGTYSWAGGFIGGNANDSAIIRVYATGEVSSTTGALAPLYAPDYADAGPAAGGIAGFSYYTKDTYVSSSVALNKIVQGNQSTAQDVVHRVAGSLGQAGHEGYLANNLANVAMSVGANWKPEYGLNRRDGLDTLAVPVQSTYAGLGWLFGSVWVMGSDGYPALQ